MSQDRTAVVHRWSQLEADEPMALLSRRRVIGDRAMISEVRLQKGCKVPMHAHENEQFAHIVSGCLRFRVETGALADKPPMAPQTSMAPDPSEAHGDSDEKELVVRAGEIIHFPSWVPHAAEALEDTVVLDIFSPPSEKTGIDRD